MKALYLHIGTHKTGTTSIQHAAGSLAKKKSHEIGWYRGPSRYDKAIMQATKYDKNLVRQFRSKLPSPRSGGNSAWISSEALCGNPNNGYQNSAVIYEMLRDATTDFSITIIIYLRKQDSFVESMYTQNIKQGETIEFDEYLMNFESQNALNYLRILQDLSKYFGPENLVVRSFHTASQRGLLSDFSEIIQDVSLENSTDQRRNPSYSRRALEVSKVCNESLNKQSKMQLRQVLQSEMPKLKGEALTFFSEKQRIAFHEKYLETNKAVAEHYLGENADKVFPITQKTDNSFDTVFSLDETAQLIKQIYKLRESNTVTDQGIRAGIKVALAAYPNLKKLLKRLSFQK